MEAWEIVWVSHIFTIPKTRMPDSMNLSSSLSDPLQLCRASPFPPSAADALGDIPLRKWAPLHAVSIQFSLIPTPITIGAQRF